VVVAINFISEHTAAYKLQCIMTDSIKKKSVALNVTVSYKSELFLTKE
jgi:hypothetical protein